MRSRAASIEGVFSLRSSPGKGTAIEVVLRPVWTVASGVAVRCADELVPSAPVAFRNAEEDVVLSVTQQFRRVPYLPG